MPEAVLRDAEAAYLDGRFGELVEKLEAAKPLSPKALVLLGRGYLNLGMRQEAISIFREALAADRGLADAVPELAVLQPGRTIPDTEADGLLPNFSLSRAGKVAARRFLDEVAAPNLSSVYANDNIIVFQRALTFLKDPKFMGSIYRSAETGVGSFDDRTWRAHILIWAARNALNLEGDFVELGTFRGYFASCIVETLDFDRVPRNFYLYDTFAGLADDAVREKNLSESFYVSLQSHYREADIYPSVVKRFEGFANVHPIKGKVPDVLFDRCADRISFLHVDLNSATHEVAALEYLWDRIVPGGIIVLDDFGFAIFRSQTDAHLEFFAGRGCPVAELPTGQGLVIKTR